MQSYYHSLSSSLRNHKSTRILSILTLPLMPRILIKYKIDCEINPCQERSRLCKFILDFISANNSLNFVKNIHTRTLYWIYNILVIQLHNILFSRIPSGRKLKQNFRHFTLKPYHVSTPQRCAVTISNVLNSRVHDTTQKWKGKIYS